MNPYRSPESVEQIDALYTVTPFRNLVRKKADVLRDQIDERAKQGWRLATSFNVGTSHHYLVWRRTTPHASEAKATPQYMILPHFSFLECVRRRSFRPWTSEVAERIAGLPVGWFVESYSSRVGYVLRYRTISTMPMPDREHYSVLRCSRDWRLTLSGDAWIPALSNVLSTSCPPESEIVACLGDDLFLTRKRQAIGQAGSSESRGGPRTYRLAMWPNWRQTLLRGTPNIAPWFQQEADRGWELLSHHTGAIFLFGNAI